MFHLFPLRSSRLACRHRGTILIFVVAILTLLVVIGTAYIVMARNDKAGVRANSEAVNFDQAQDAVLNQLRGIMFDATLDSQGKLLAYAGGTGTSQSRFYDYPEISASFGTSAYYPATMVMPDQPWLCSGLYPTSTVDVSLLTAKRFDPSAGTFTAPNPAAAEVDVIGPIASNAVSTALYVNPNTPVAPIASTNNAIYYLLPFSSPSGVHYRYAVRIIDTNRMANLNTANPNVNTPSTDPLGQYLSSYSLAYSIAGSPRLIAAGDANPVPGIAINLQDGLVNGRTGTSTIVTTNAGYFANWHQQILTLEKPTAANLAANTVIQPFDLTDELELRTYGCTGTTYLSRPQLAGLSNTLQASVAPASSFRPNLTTWSFDRNFRPYPDPTIAADGTTVLPHTANGVGANWPAAPRKVWANPNIPGTAAGMLTLAQTASNLATAMEAVANGNGAAYSYTHNEAVAFAANYLTHFSAGIQLPGSSPPIYSTYNPNVASVATPTLSFIDDQGICVRWPGSASQNYTGANDLKAPSGSAVFGYAAQPFLTELAAVVVTSTADTTKSAYGFCAIEIYNPYPVALDLTGWKINSYSGTLVTFGQNANGVDASAVTSIKANGIIVVQATFTGGTLPIDASAVTLDASHATNYPTGFIDPTGVKSVYLTRPYWTRGAALGDAPVDSFGTIPFILPATPPAAPVNLSYQRPFTDNTTWNFTNAAAIPLAPSLGLPNNGTPLSGPAIQLYDRCATTLGSNGLPITNIADFNHIARVANWSNGTTITGQIQGFTGGGTPAILGGSKFPIEGRLYFDFLAMPLYYAAPNPLIAPPPVGNGDPRAITLLDYIVLVDRASDSTIDLGFGPNDINKIRIPGRINANTASGFVLRGVVPITPPSLPVVSPPITEAVADKIVANIAAFRGRTNVYISNSVTSDDFTFAANPANVGLGIRSLAELYYPVSMAAGNPTTSISARDQAWATIFNNVTTRSDTFVVYGVLEAATANAGHNNGTHWYDPTNANQTVLYRRRFIAIIDRGFANAARGTSTFSLPRVVAYKELPN